MNDTPIKTPTLAELAAAGYSINVEHNRLHKFAVVKNGKMIVKEILSSHVPGLEHNSDDSVLTLLPKGGMTNVWVTDPETKVEFYGYSRCHPNDNYSKRDGINEALKRIAALMLVTDGVDGFNLRLQL
jgi:hypothetical protein